MVRHYQCFCNDCYCKDFLKQAETSSDTKKVDNLPDSKQVKDHSVDVNEKINHIRDTTKKVTECEPDTGKLVTSIFDMRWWA
jgi:hypothetical protein